MALVNTAEDPFMTKQAMPGIMRMPDFPAWQAHMGPGEMMSAHGSPAVNQQQNHLTPPLPLRSVLMSRPQLSPMQGWGPMQGPPHPHLVGSPPSGRPSPRDIFRNIEAAVTEFEREYGIDHDSQGVAEERLKWLEGELAEIVPLQEEQARQHSNDLQRMTDLEQQNAELKRGQADLARENATHCSRAGELEEALGISRASEEKFMQQHAFESNRIIDLEKLLLEKEDVIREDAKHRVRCDTLEQELSSLGSIEADHVQRLEMQRQKMSELEQSLFEAEHARDQLSHKAARVSELELLLEEYEASDARHVQQAMGLRHSIANLEKDLDEARATEQTLTIRENSQRSALTELEQRLDLSEAGEARLKSQNKKLSDQVLELEVEMTDLRARETSHSRQHHTLQARVTELEQELLEYRDQSHNHQRRATELELELSGHGQLRESERLKRLELEQRVTSIQELETRLELLGRELADERRTSHDLRDTIENTRIASSKVAQDFEQAVSTERKALTIEWELKLEHTLEKNSHLEEQLRKEMESNGQLRFLLESKRGSGSIPIGTVKSSPRLSAALTAPRALPDMPRARQVLPNSNQAFAVRVRTAVQNTTEIMNKLGRAQAIAISSQLETTGGDMHASTRSSSSQRHELQGELSTLHAQVCDLHALQEELETHHELQAHERKELATCLDAELKLCGDQQQLVRDSQFCGLSELPQDFIDELKAAHQFGRLSSTSPSGESPSPLHRAAQHGRRDVIEYILRSIPDARGVILSKDSLGRTVLDVARAAGFQSLERWLHEVAHDEATYRAMQPLPGSSSLSGRGSMTRTSGPRVSFSGVAAEPSRPRSFSGTGTTPERRLSAPDRPMSSGGTSLQSDRAASLSFSSATRRASDSNPILKGSLASTRVTFEDPPRASLQQSLQWQAPNDMPPSEQLLASRVSRPEVADMPDQYKELLVQIETRGWSSVTWKRDYTMVHWAAGKGHGQLCRYLVQLGADPGLRDSKGRTPADLALKDNYPEVALLLEELTNSPIIA